MTIPSGSPGASGSTDRHTIDVLANGAIDDGAVASQPTEENMNGDCKQRLIDCTTSKRKKIGLCLSWVISIYRSFFIHPGKSEDSSCIRLYKAASRGDWKTAEEIEMKDRGILSKIICEDRKETALHIATRFNQAYFVEKLLQKLSKEDLEAKNIYKNTALCIASTIGAVDIAKLMLAKHKDLLEDDATPILIAVKYKNKAMVEYLLAEMDSILLKMDIKDQMELLLGAIFADYYDVALDILKKNESLALALTSDINRDTPLHIMARKSNFIASYKKTIKWQSCANNKRGFQYIFKKTTMQIKAHEMVAKMWSIVVQSSKSLNENDDKLKDYLIEHPPNMLHEAAKVGNVEFLEVLLHANPQLLRMFDNNGKSIFHVAVENRQHRVFGLIYDMKLLNPDDLIHYFEDETISLLDLAAKIPNQYHLDRVSGAVFQMHSELLWFKELEDIEELTTRSMKKGVETERTTFSDEHKNLKEEGEKWVKKTANSCMLVATLIATVTFAAAFTVPGGKNETRGFPIFLDRDWFTVFMISDGIAMITSSTAILLFLSILTSRCAENDFLFWLPLELVGGLGSLFVSILNMVLAFAAAFFLYYDKTTARLPLWITGMAIVPIFWFCVLQWKLWAHALVSLYSTAMTCFLWKKKTRVLRIGTRCCFVWPY